MARLARLLVVAFGLLLLIGAAYWFCSLNQAKSELAEARARLDAVVDTPAYEGYHRMVDWDARAATMTPPAMLPFSPSFLEAATSARLPKASEIVLNAIDDCLNTGANSDRWMAILRGPWDKPVLDWNEADLRQVETFLQEREEVIEALALLVARGGPQPLPSWLSESREMLHYGHNVRQADGLLKMTALLKAAKGDSDGSCEALHLIMTLADRLPGQPLLAPTADTKARWLYSRAIETIEQLPVTPPLSRSQILRLCSHLARGKARQSFVDGMAVTLYGGIKGFRKTAQKLPSRMFRSDLDWLVLCSYRTPLGQPLRRRDEAALLQGSMALIELAAVYAATPNGPYVAVAPRRFDPDSMPPVAVASQPVVSHMWRSFKSHANTEAHIDVTRLGLLVELLQRENGRFPESLDLLEPDLGEPIPKDPFTGESFRYRPTTDDGFLLYSIGSNGVDDGGYFDFTAGDIVWRGEADETLVKERNDRMMRLFEKETGLDLSADDEEDEPVD